MCCKDGSGDLKQALCNLNQKNEQILVGFDTSDDAGIFQIDENLALVQTVDFITPVVDDPYIYGQIAAANSLSDIFAMGGEVKTALNIVGFDSTNVSKEALGEILRGGLEKKNKRVWRFTIRWTHYSNTRDVLWIERNRNNSSKRCKKKQ